MSINKVLNRPMFRKMALKKGHLKPIHAQTGIMVGPTMDVNTRPQRFPIMNVPQPKAPTMIQRLGRGLRAIGQVPFIIGSDLTYGALTKSDTGNNLSEPVKIGAAGLAGLAANYGAARAAPALMGMGFLPSTLALGTFYGLKNRFDAGVELRKKINAMSPEERAEFSRQQRAKAFSYMDDDAFDEQFGGFKPKPPVSNEEIKEEVEVSKKIRPRNPRCLGK